MWDGQTTYDKLQTLSNILTVLASSKPIMRRLVGGVYYYIIRDFGFSPSDSLGSLIFQDKISCRWATGFFRTGGGNRGTPFKKTHLTTAAVLI